jgi:hypothetical protein
VISIGIKNQKRNKRLYIRLRKKRMKMKMDLSMHIFSQSKNVLTKFTRKYWKLNNFKIMRDNKRKCMKIIKLNCKGVFFG